MGDFTGKHKDGCTRSDSFAKYYNGLDTSLLENMYLKHFVSWYIKGADPKTFKKWGTLTDDMNKALDTYLYRPDVQKWIIEYTKRQRELNLIKVYNVMLKNALEGDVQSANWLITFSKSDFFENKENELEEFVKGLSTDE